MPKNKLTNVEYKKSNAITLLDIQKEKSYNSNEWLTFLQAKELNLNVKKGEKGVRLCRVFENDEKSDSVGKTKKAIKFFTVFNIEQCEIIN